MRSKVIMNIAVPRNTSGSAIILAVRKAADVFKEEEFYEDEKILYLVGQQSEYSQKDFLVQVSEDGKIFDNAINPNATYSWVRICSYGFEGRKFTFDGYDEDILKKSWKFRDKLQAEIRQVSL